MKRKSYIATAKTIIAARNYFKENPNGVINTGVWTSATFTKKEFEKWFSKCLQLKCGGKPLNDYDTDLMYDARIINDYYRGKKWRGTGILKTRKMQQKYPHINNNI